MSVTATTRGEFETFTYDLQFPLREASDEDGIVGELTLTPTTETACTRPTRVNFPEITDTESRTAQFDEIGDSVSLSLSVRLSEAPTGTVGIWVDGTAHELTLPSATPLRHILRLLGVATESLPADVLAGLTQTLREYYGTDGATCAEQFISAMQSTLRFDQYIVSANLLDARDSRFESALHRTRYSYFIEAFLSRAHPHAPASFEEFREMTTRFSRQPNLSDVDAIHGVGQILATNPSDPTIRDRLRALGVDPTKEVSSPLFAYWLAHLTLTDDSHDARQLVRSTCSRNTSAYDRLCNRAESTRPSNRAAAWRKALGAACGRGNDFEFALGNLLYWTGGFTHTYARSNRLLFEAAETLLDEGTLLNRCAECQVHITSGHDHRRRRNGTAAREEFKKARTIARDSHVHPSVAVAAESGYAAIHGREAVLRDDYRTAVDRYESGLEALQQIDTEIRLTPLGRYERSFLQGKLHEFRAYLAGENGNEDQGRAEFNLAMYFYAKADKSRSVKRCRRLRDEHFPR